MSKPFPIFLIDLDSVLIEPRGYRKAIQSTLGYFTKKMGLGDLYPGEEAIARFESINMTCEWDITPILLAAVFDGVLKENPRVIFPDTDLFTACASIQKLHLNPPTLELERITAILGNQFKPGMEYASLAWELNQPSGEQPPFPSLVGHPLLDRILKGTRDLDGALTTHVFQHFTLGSDRFQALCGETPFFESESYLQSLDKVLLNSDTRDILLKTWKNNQLGAAVFTARPSLPEKGGAASFNYSPEAEVALEALELTELPLIGAGKMGWLATQLNLRVDQLTKPSPVQALSAITAAFTRQTESALWSAAGVYFDHKLDGYEHFPALSIHVFEDAGGNINAVRKAAEILATAGIQNQVTAWGIAEDSEKQSALRQAGANLLSDVNQAIRQAFILEGILK